MQLVRTAGRKKADWVKPTLGTNGQPSSNAGGQGTARQSGNSLGGERRPATADERNIERP